MPTNLTGSQIKDTYDQLLHVDGGPTAAEKPVYSAAGVATALRVGVESASVDNVRIDGNTISTLNTNGNLVLSPNGTGSVSMSRVAISGGIITGITDLPVADGGTGASDASGARTNLGLGSIATQNSNNVSITGGTITGITDLAVADGGTGASDASGARTNLGLGTIATQNSNNVSITGGSITGVVFTGSFSGITSITSDAFYTSAAAAGLTLADNDLLADGTDTNIDIDLIPKGTGEVNISKVDIDGGTIDGTTIGGATPAAGTFTDNLATDSVGFATGAGGTVTQITSRTTGVTLNASCGEITLVAGSLAGHEADEFTLTNSEIGANDVVIVNIKSGATAAERRYYTVTVTSVSAGSCTISIGNNDNGAVPAAGTDTLVLSFAVIKGVTS